MGVGAHSVTSIVASCRKGQKSQKNNIKANKSLKCQTHLKKGQKRAKKPNQKFQGQERSKKTQFDLFGLALGQNGNPAFPIPWRTTKKSTMNRRNSCCVIVCDGRRFRCFKTCPSTSYASCLCTSWVSYSARERSSSTVMSPYMKSTSYTAVSARYTCLRYLLRIPVPLQCA